MSIDKDEVAKLAALSEAVKRKKEIKKKEEPSGGMGTVFIVLIFLVALIFIITR